MSRPSTAEPIGSRLFVSFPAEGSSRLATLDDACAYRQLIPFRKGLICHFVPMVASFGEF